MLGGSYNRVAFSKDEFKLQVWIKEYFIVTHAFRQLNEIEIEDIR